MSPWRALARREVRGWLLYPGHYVMAAAFLAASGLGFWMLALSSAGHGVLTSELTFGGTMFWLSVTALVALVSTRPLSEERERGTIELLLTAPVRERDVVGAVYAGALILLLAICIPAVAAPWMLRLLAPGWTGVDAGAWMAGCVGLGCALAWLTAVGVLASVLFRRQTTAATVTFLAGLIILFGGTLTEWAGGSRGLVTRVALALHTVHTGGFADGFLDARAVTFAVVVAAWCLAAAVKGLEWSREPARGRMNGVMTLMLAAVLGAMILTVSYRHPKRWDWSASRSRPVSERTAHVLGELTQPVRVSLMGQSDDPLTAVAWRLLKRYPLASPMVTVEWVDPDRDLGTARELGRLYGVHEAGMVVVRGGDRHRVVALRRAVTEGDDGGGADRRTATAGRLDAALASAVYAVANQAVVGVYFLTGHGERSISDYGDYTGYGEIADRVRDMQAGVRSVALDPQAALSNDCSVLVIAGPSLPFSAQELARLRDFVQRGGRLMMLLDSGTDTGLAEWVAEWGILADNRLVLDPSSGQAFPLRHVRSAAVGMGEVQVMEYGRHPIAAGLGGLVATLHLPRPIEAAVKNAAAGNATDQADRPRVTVFARSSASSWVESDLTRSPAQFNEGFDRRGPVGLAACVEKGAASAVNVGIRPTRLVVFGDSQFAANRCLAGANARLFLNALDWLLDEGGLAESPETMRGQFDLQLGHRERRLAFVLIVTGPPALALMCGLWVAVLRRDRRPGRVRGAGEGVR
jgi:hypothetical protein